MLRADREAMNNPVKMTKSQRVLQKHMDYVERLKQSNKPIIRYDCPSCSSEIETLRPPKAEQLDGSVCCPFCSGLHFKVVSNRGVSVEVIKR